MSYITDLDRRHLWHPFTQHETERDPVVISHARGASLFTETGQEILDLISSWWCCTHGHSHPELNKALAQQAKHVPHVMFAGFTHEPAVKLAQKLTEKLGHGLSRVFYSDNGSSAIEVALKMAYQYWKNKGEAGRKSFVAFEGGYHGDTLGAMSLGKGSGFFSLYQDLMCSVHIAPFAETWAGDETIEERETMALLHLKKLLEREGQSIAALIIEPLMQGAAGFRLCRPHFVQSVINLARQYNSLVILDEVATGFGRTGTMFAFEQAQLVPDIICLSKGLTAGYMPLSVTVTREDIFQEFLGADFSKAFAHGHTFTANPLACAVALRSLQLFEDEKTMERIQHIQQYHQNFLHQLQAHPLVHKGRALGVLLACDLRDEGGYQSEDSLFLKQWYVSHGLNIRPLGSCVYLLPPYCITDEQLTRAYVGLLEGLEALRAKKMRPQ